MAYMVYFSYEKFDRPAQKDGFFMAIIITLPTPDFTPHALVISNFWLQIVEKIVSLKKTIFSFIQSVLDRIQHFSLNNVGSFGTVHSPTKSTSHRLFGRNPFNPKVKLILGVILLLLVISGFSYNYFRNRARTLGANTDQSTVRANLAETTLNRSFTFPGKNAQGLPSGQVNFIITKVEKSKEVLVQGRPANAKGDKAFLVLNIEIENAAVDKVYLTPVDYLRLTGPDGKKYAPDIHSDVVEVQPISTKVTRVGFVVFESQQSFQIQVGELTGDKETLDISF